MSVWKFIRNCWVFKNFRFLVARVIQIRFWHDIWCSNVALKHAFPSLYSASDKGASVANYMDMFSGFL